MNVVLKSLLAALLAATSIYSAQGFPSKGEARALVLLVEFRDIKFSGESPASYAEMMLNGRGFTSYGAQGSVAEYFIEQSGGLFHPVFDLAGPYTLPQTRAYYGTNTAEGADKAVSDIALHAAALADESVDFSIYDLDGDGCVDNLFIIYAGQSETGYGPAVAPKHGSGRLSDEKKSIELDNTIIDRYTCVNEWEEETPSGPGIFVYELARLLGIPSESNPSDPNAHYTPSSWSLMDTGMNNNGGFTPPNLSAFEKMMAGWFEPEVIDGPESVVLGVPGDSPSAIMLPTLRENEYFILENRRRTERDRFLPGEGLLIWHIDYDADVFEAGRANAIPTYQRIDIVEACGVANSHNQTLLSAYTWPGPDGADSFDPIDWAGRKLGLPVSDITELPDGSISFNIAGGAILPAKPGGLSASGTEAGLCFFAWHPVEGAEGYILSIRDESGETEEFSVETSEFRIDTLEPEHRYSWWVYAFRGKLTGENSEIMEVEMPALDWIYKRPAVYESEPVEYGFKALWEPMYGAVEYILDVLVEKGRGFSNAVCDFGHNGTLQLELPEGWEWNGGSSDIYLKNSVGMFGESAPSLKFSPTGNELTTAPLPGEIREVEFWLRSAAGSLGDNELRVECSDSKTDVWQLIEEIRPEAEGQTIVLSDIPEGMNRLRFVYNRRSANMALDDIRVTTFESLPTNVSDLKEIHTGTPATSREIVLAGQPAGFYSYTLRGIDGDGRLTRPAYSGQTEWTASSSIENPAEAEDALCRIEGRLIKVSGNALRVYSIAGSLIADLLPGESVELTTGIYIAAGSGRAEKIAIH